MDRARAPASLEVAHYGRQIRSSLGWLVVSLFLGGAPLAVYVTTPQAPVANLFLALILGLPTFTLALVDLGKAKAVILDPERRRLRYLEGLYSRRKVRDISFDEVRGLWLRRQVVGATGGDGGGGTMEWWELHIDLGHRKELCLEHTTFERASREARHLGTRLGIRPMLDDKPLTDPVVPAPMLGPKSAWTVFLYAVLCTLGAALLAITVVLGLRHYLNH